MLLRLLFASVAVFLVAPLNAAEGGDYSIRLMPYAWFAQAGGSFSYEDQSIDGSELDADSFDELDDIEPSPALEAGLRLPFMFDIYAGVFSLGFEGDTTFSSPKTFGGDVHLGDASAEIELLDVYGEIGFNLPIPSTLGGVSAGLAVHTIRSDVALSSSTASGSFDDTVLVPVGALRAYINPVPKVSVEGKLHLMSLEVDDVDVQFVDFLAMVTYSPWQQAGFSLGYRFVDWDIEYQFSDSEEGNVDLDIGGPFLGVVLQF